ncbi:MAG: endonuclease/exonuclease/phosphatase family protein [Minisyncoccia bacterium]
MKIKILTANIAFGLNDMNNLFANFYAHYIFHGWSIITFIFNPKSLKHKLGYMDSKRVRYLKKHSKLEQIISLIKKEDPKIVFLNELLIQLHRDGLENSLQKMGYKSFAWGQSAHYADSTVSSFVASKTEGEAVEVFLPQESHAGGGGGIAAIRLAENNITAIAVHMSVLAKFSWLYEAQLEAIANFISEEEKRGRKVVIGGDWNASNISMQKYQLFSKLNFKNSEGDLLTCPTFLPKLNPLDHIYVPQNWKTVNTKTAAFGSDHLAVIVEEEF